MPTGGQHGVAASTYSSRPTIQSNRPRPACAQRNATGPRLASRVSCAPSSNKSVLWNNSTVCTTLMEEDAEEKDDEIAPLPAGRSSMSYAAAASGVSAAVAVTISPQPQVTSSAEVGQCSLPDRQRFPTAQSRLSSKFTDGPGSRRDIYQPSNTRGPQRNAQIPRGSIVRSTIRAPSTVFSAQRIIPGRHYENLRMKDFNVGMIFTASHYVEMMDKNVPKDDPSRIESKVGVCSAKERHMIVISKFGGSLLTLSLTSKGSRGLSAVREDFQAQYMEIRHSDGPPPTKGALFPPVQVEDWAMGYPLGSESLIRLVEPYIIQCGQPVRIEGMILKESYDQIKAQFNTLLDDSFKASPYGM